VPPLPSTGRPRLFGDAVLTEAAIASTDSQDFEAQAGIERRRWLCVTTRVDVDVCTAHLNTRSTVEVAGERGAVLRARRASRASRGRTHRHLRWRRQRLEELLARPVTAGEELDRRRSCAPAGLWTRTDGSAEQAPGLQRVYGSSSLRSPSAEVVPATRTDHDLLLLHTHLTVPE
jgi:hypothetical protein